jgi:hypothetical protein
MMIALSPYTHYQLRKLLPDLLHFAYLPINQTELANPANLEKVLHHLLHRLQKSPNAVCKTQELDILVPMYCENVHQQSSTHQRILEIKRRILALLGLNQTLVNRLKQSLFISEQSTRLFNFYFSGKMCQGCNYDDELYGLIREFPANRKLQAFLLIWALVDQKVVCLLTFSKVHYRIWISLRSRGCSTLLLKDQAIESLQLLHLRACKLRQDIMRQAN